MWELRKKCDSRMTQISNQHGRGKHVKPDVKLEVLTEALSYERYQMPKGNV